MVLAEFVSFALGQTGARLTPKGGNSWFGDVWFVLIGPIFNLTFL